MSEIKVIYASLTGNTAKVARAIAEALGVAAVDVRDLGAEDIANAKLLFVGDGVYGWRPSRRMVRFLSGLRSLAGVKAAIFGTYGARPVQLPVLKRLLAEKGAEVVGEFACPGVDWFTLGLLRRGRPNREDLDRARSFAREVAWKAGYPLPESSS